jgi:tetratricopeptide (TPR) repeat protein
VTDADRLSALAREADFDGPGAAGWAERLAPKKDVLIEAAGSLLDEGRDDDAAELAARTWRPWRMTGDSAGGRRMMAAAIRDGGPPSGFRALVLYADGLFLFREGDQEASLRRNEEAREVARAVGDKGAEALAMVGLSRVAFRAGDYERTRDLARQARELVQGGDPSDDIMPLHLLAAGTRLAGDLDEAVELYTESLERGRKLGDQRMVVLELHNLGHVEIHRGNIETAERYFEELAEVRSASDPYDQAMARLNRAAVAFARGDRASAKELLATVEPTLEAAGIVLDPDDAYEVEWLRGELTE